MYNREDHPTHLSIKRAFENLHSLSQAGSRQGAALVCSDQIDLLGDTMSYRYLHFDGSEHLSIKPKENFNIVIKETLDTVMHHMHGYCEKAGRYLGVVEVFQGAGSLMHLVDQAISGLDQVRQKDTLSKNISVKREYEYQRLTEFYKKQFENKGVHPNTYIAVSDRHLEKSIDQDLSVIEDNKSELPQSYQELLGQLEYLDQIQDDSLYEFYYLHRQEGGYCLKANMIRQMQVFCDFAKESEVEASDANHISWSRLQDKAICNLCDELYKNSYFCMNTFIKGYHPSYDHEVKGFVSKALYALLLGSAKVNLYETGEKKSCSEYYRDFLFFLRKVLKHPQYIRMSALKEVPRKWVALFNLLNAWGKTLFNAKAHWKEAGFEIISLLKKSREAHTLWSGSQLTKDYHILREHFQIDGEGSLRRCLRRLKSGWRRMGFDPHLMGYHNYKLFDLKSSTQIWHLPSIVSHSNLAEAFINPELSLMASNLNENEKCLLINLQDRNSYREHARCEALERKMPSSFEVMTLDTSSEFYHQEAEWFKGQVFSSWRDVFLEKMTSPLGGYYFPRDIKNMLKKKLPTLLSDISAMFFERKNVMTRVERLQFIDLTYAILSLKIIKSKKFTHASMITKDGLGQSLSSSGLLYLIDKHLTGPLEDKDLHMLDQILYCPSLMQREKLTDLQWVQRLSFAAIALEQTLCRQGRKIFQKNLKNLLKPW